MSGLGEIRNKFNNLDVDYKTKKAVKAEIIKAVENDGKIDSNDTALASAVSKIKSPEQRQKLSEIINNIKSEVDTKFNSGQGLNQANIVSSKAFVAKLLKNDDILFVGMNSRAKETKDGYGEVNGEKFSASEATKADRESGAIKIKRHNLILIKDTTKDIERNSITVKGSDGTNTKYDLNDKSGIDNFVSSLGLPKEKEKPLSDLIEKVKDSQSDDLDAVDEFANVVQLWAKGEQGEEIPSRMVISGHNYSGGVYGDGNGSLDLDHLKELGAILPNAASQVEDLALSACNSGWEKDMDRYKETFPNIKTVMAYTNVGSSSDVAKFQLQKWEKNTRGDVDILDRKKLQIGTGEVSTRDVNITTYSAGKTGSTYNKMDMKSLGEIKDLGTKLEFIKEVSASINLQHKGEHVLLDFRGDDHHHYDRDDKGMVLPVVSPFKTNEEDFRIGRTASFVKDKDKVNQFIKDLNAMKEIPDRIKVLLTDQLKAHAGIK